MARGTNDTKQPKLSPAMQQHRRFKDENPGCVLFFQMGDFFELFDDDALTLGEAVGLRIAERTKGQPMAGVPIHRKDEYVRRASDLGFKIAIATQTQDASEAKGVVERAVTQIITPGTATDEALVTEDESVHLAAVVFHDDDTLGAAIVESTTGHVWLLDSDAETARDELARLRVREVLYAESQSGTPERVSALTDAIGAHATARPGWTFREQEAVDAIHSAYGVASLDGFAMQGDHLSTCALGVALRYLSDTQFASREGIARLGHLAAPRRIVSGTGCLIDQTSRRALELDRTIRDGSIDGSLLGVFTSPGEKGGSLARTGMGRRSLADWLTRPLSDLDAIRARHAVVGVLVADRVLAGEIDERLRRVHDLARLAGRLALARTSPRDLAALSASILAISELPKILDGTQPLAELRQRIESHLTTLVPLAQKLDATLSDELPSHIREGGVIRDGVDDELDESRGLQRDAGAWLVSYQAKLTAEHDLPNLKVGFNRVFGYYIELPKGQSSRAPDSFSRRQTLKGAERYITPELKTFEDKVLNAETRALSREKALFAALCEQASSYSGEASKLASDVGELDAMAAFGTKAHRRAWVRPEMTEDPTLDIVAGRHPVLDESLAGDFVPNDVSLGTRDAPPMGLITGPNMAGKSTFIRQVALLTILSHAGSFVPAESAVIGRTDRVFTRVGADDALHRGQSTFMVEMAETANILNNVTPASLVVLDEIGRGTSTLDGLSLAWAITEHLALGSATPVSGAMPRSLFATHYHELTELAERHPKRIHNLRVAVREWKDEIVFVHRIEPGKTDRSYGVHVAKIAGVPKPVTDRATELLGELSVRSETNRVTPASVPTSTSTGTSKPVRSSDEPTDQLGLFGAAPHPALDRLRELKLDSMSPLEAFDALRSLIESARAR